MSATIFHKATTKKVWVTFVGCPLHQRHGQAPEKTSRHKWLAQIEIAFVDGTDLHVWRVKSCAYAELKVLRQINQECVGQRSDVGFFERHPMK
jgi:hypothetical protein